MESNKERLFAFFLEIAEDPKSSLNESLLNYICLQGKENGRRERGGFKTTLQK